MTSFGVGLLLRSRELLPSPKSASPRYARSSHTGVAERMDYRYTHHTIASVPFAMKWTERGWAIDGSGHRNET